MDKLWIKDGYNMDDKKLPAYKHELKVGETYKNWKGNWRTITNMWNEYTKGDLVSYYDGTGATRTCREEAFRIWINKQYY